MSIHPYRKIRSALARIAPVVVTLDGAAAVGKSTVAYGLAKKAGLSYLDSGSLFRTVTFLLRQRQSVEVEALRGGHFDAALGNILGEVNTGFDVRWINERPRVFFDNDDIEDAIRTEENGALTSLVSQRPIVRAELLRYQRDFAKKQHFGTIAVGRDAGSVVFPDADLKVFLTAAINVRTYRRYQELMEKGLRVTRKEIANDLKKRDELDRNRPVAPLICPKGAFRISTTRRSIDQVIEKIQHKINLILNNP